MSAYVPADGLTTWSPPLQRPSPAVGGGADVCAASEEACCVVKAQLDGILVEVLH